MADSFQTSQSDAERRLAEVNTRLAEIKGRNLRELIAYYKWLWYGTGILVVMGGLALWIRHEPGLILLAIGFVGFAACIGRAVPIWRKSMPLERERGRLLTERRRLRKLTGSR